MDSKEVIFWNFKNNGGFSEFKNYEEYKNRNEKNIIFIPEQKETRSDKIQKLKDNYNPPPTDPNELKKYIEERKRIAHEEWKKKHLITEEDKSIIITLDKKL